MAYSSRDTQQIGFEDVFATAVVNNSSTELEIGSHYPINPERWRFFVNGTRNNPQYNAVSQYNHATDVHELSPSAGETVVMQTSERVRYTVQRELSITGSFSVNQSLNPGDIVRFGYFDDQDGWFIEKNGSHSNGEIDLVSRRNGTEIYRNTKTSSNLDLTKFKRYDLRTAWYNVSRQAWGISFAKDGEQINEIIGESSYDDGRGPMVGNNHVRFEVTAAAGTTGLTLEAGSIGVDTLGNTNIQFRAKAAYFSESVGSTNVWVPILAFRVKPSLKRVVNTQLREISALRYGGSSFVKLGVNAFDSNNVAFSSGSWTIPSEWSGYNNSLEVHRNISSIVDSTGTSVAAPANPGGHQIGYSVLTPSGKNFNKGESSDNLGVRRNLPNNDIAVVMANSSTTGAVDFTTNWEQDW